MSDHSDPIVMPIPDDAPHPPSTSGDNWKFIARWTYKNSAGDPLFHTVRFEAEGGAKKVTPQILKRTKSGLRWSWGAPPEPRPLFGLEKLALADAGAHILIVEGEKCAVAGEGSFPDFVTLTSQGGAKAPQKSDWTPLLGRKVTIWPDADKPGEEYAISVGSTLVALGCEVALVDAEKLASIQPDGGTRKPPEGWDLVDAIAEWESSAALLAAVSEHTSPFKPEALAEEPLPLFKPMPEPLPYPVESLGMTAGGAVRSIANKCQVPVALAAQSILASISLACQAHANVRLPFGQDRPISLFLVSIAASGDRKTTSDNEALRAVRRKEKELNQQRDKELEKFNIDLAAWEATQAVIKRKPESLESAKADLEELGPRPKPPLYPYLIVADPTIEGVVKAWPDAQASLGLFSSEGGTFFGGYGMSMDNKLRTSAALSTLWDGEPVTQVRAGAGVLTLRGRRLSLHLMAQPDAASIFLTDPVIRDQGLLSRILLAAPTSLAGSRFSRPTDPSDDKNLERFEARLHAALSRTAKMEEGKLNVLEPPVIPLHADASALFFEYSDHIEQNLAPEHEFALIKDVAAKAPENASRIACLLAVFEDPTITQLSGDYMRRGIAISNWHLSEAKRLLLGSGVDPKLKRAQVLLDWLQNRGHECFSCRDIHQKGPSSLRHRAIYKEALLILMDHHWIAPVPGKPSHFILRKAS